MAKASVHQLRAIKTARAQPVDTFLFLLPGACGRVRAHSILSRCFNFFVKQIISIAPPLSMNPIYLRLCIARNWVESIHGSSSL